MPSKNRETYTVYKTFLARWLELCRIEFQSHFKKLQRIYGKDKSDFNELHAEFDSTILDDQPGDHVMPFPTLVNLLISDLQALDNQSLLELGLHTSRKSL